MTNDDKQAAAEDIVVGIVEILTTVDTNVGESDITTINELVVTTLDTLVDNLNNDATTAPLVTVS